ncbi:MAG: fibronectin type III domain-containing protein, partial [Candidatus Zixiibacteriota bacterium]
MNRRLLTVLLTLIAVLSSGCGRHIDSRDPVRSLPENGPIPFDVTVEINDRSVGLSWRVNDTTDVAKYRIYVGEADGTFVLRDSSTTTKAILDGLPLNRVHLFAVSAVSTNGLEWDRSNPASGTVIPLSITIENDDEFSNNRSVFVQLHVGTATTHLSLSEDSSRLDESFVQFTGTQTPFTLSDGDGPKRVYARVIFSDGARSGLPLYDDIMLDRRAEISSTSFSPLSKVFSQGDTILFSVDGGESGGQASVTVPGFGIVDLFDDGSSLGD